MGSRVCITSYSPFRGLRGTVRDVHTIADDPDDPFCFYLIALDRVHIKEPVWFECTEVEFVALAGSAPATLQVIGVVQLPTAWCGPEALTALRLELQAHLHREVQRYLAAVIARLQQNPLAQHHAQLTSSVEFGVDVAETLLHAAAPGLAAERDARAGEGFDLLVMTTHGHGGVPPGAPGKVTARVLSAASVPLLLVPPPG